MADWYVDTCEDLGKELIKLGHRALSDVLDITVWVDGKAINTKKLEEVLFDDGGKVRLNIYIKSNYVEE